MRFLTWSLDFDTDINWHDAVSGDECFLESDRSGSYSEETGSKQASRDILDDQGDRPSTSRCISTNIKSRIGHGLDDSEWVWVVMEMNL